MSGIIRVAGFSIVGLLLFWSCQPQERVTLSYWGPSEMVYDSLSGKKVKQHYELAFSGFSDQDGREVSSQSLDGKIYLVDFFFTSCPTICPQMKAQLLNVYNELQEEDFEIVSVTIDAKHDSIPVLKRYSERLGVNGEKWHFATSGLQQYNIDLAERLMLFATEDKNAPGGFYHSSNIVLIDQNGHIRGYFDLLKEGQTEFLIEAIQSLIN